MFGTLILVNVTWPTIYSMAIGVTVSLSNNPTPPFLGVKAPIILNLMQKFKNSISIPAKNPRHSELVPTGFSFPGLLHDVCRRSVRQLHELDPDQYCGSGGRTGVFLPHPGVAVLPVRQGQDRVRAGDHPVAEERSQQGGGTAGDRLCPGKKHLCFNYSFRKI